MEMTKKVIKVEHTPRQDARKTGLTFNYSIHPYRNEFTGRRQVYNTCKPKKKR